MSENITVLAGGQGNETITVKMDPSSLCGPNGTAEGAEGACNVKGLGISLSTPILMMTTGVLGNLLALLVLFTAGKQVRRTSYFPLLLASACSDFVGQAATGAIAVLVYANNLKWVGGRPLCQYHGFAMVFFAVITPLLVCSMSVERLLALRYSYFYQRFFTHGIARWVVFSTVTFTLFFCSLPMMGLGSYDHQFPGSWCFLNYHRQSVKDMAYALMFSVLNISIIGFIVGCNVTVVYTLLKMRRLRRQMNGVPGTKATGARGKALPIRQRSRSALKPEMETQMVWFLLAITVVFSCLWLPINVHILMNQITGEVNYKQDLISVRLASINQIIDPWMYVIFRKTTFLKLLRRLRRFVTRRKKSTGSSAKLSQSCAENRHHQPLVPPRRQSCPPAVCLGVVLPTDGDRTRPLPHTMFLVLPPPAAKAMETSMNGDPDVMEKKGIVGKEGLGKLRETPDILEDILHDDLVMAQAIREEMENGLNLPNGGVVTTDGTLTLTEEDAKPMKDDVGKTNTASNIVTNECRTKSSRPHSFRKGFSVPTADFIEAKDHSDVVKTIPYTNRTLDTEEDIADLTKASLASRCADTYGRNSSQAPEHKGQFLGNGCTNAHNRADCFEEIELVRCENGLVNGHRNADTQLKNRTRSATDDVDIHVNGSPFSSFENEVEDHVESHLLAEKSQTGTTADTSTSFCVDNAASDEANTSLDPLCRVSRSKLQRQFCDVHNDFASETSSPGHIPTDCEENTADCETTRLLRTNGCVNPFSPNHMNFCQCSHAEGTSNAVRNGVTDDCYDKLLSATDGEKLSHSAGDVFVHT